MSRAINVNAPEAHVTGTCAKQDAVITSIETLHSGGTRVVLADGDAAARVRRAYGGKVITGAVRRQPMRIVHTASSTSDSFTGSTSPRAAASDPWKPRN